MFEIVLNERMRYLESNIGSHEGLDRTGQLCLIMWIGPPFVITFPSSVQVPTCSQADRQLTNPRLWFCHMDIVEAQYHKQVITLMCEGFQAR